MLGKPSVAFRDTRAVYPGEQIPGTPRSAFPTDGWGADRESWLYFIWRRDSPWA